MVFEKSKAPAARKEFMVCYVIRMQAEGLMEKE